MACRIRKFIALGCIALLSEACTLWGSTSTSLVSADSGQKKEQKKISRPSWDAWLKAWSVKEAGQEATKVFALLSSGGFAGAGKGHWILFIPESKAATLVYVEPSLDIPSVTETPKLSRSTPASEVVKNFLARSGQFPDTKFEPEHPAVDGWRYSYYRFDLNDSKLQKLVHFDMDSPYFGKESSKDHQLLIESFEELLKKNP